MAKFYDTLTDDLMDFIRAQHVFFTGTAASEGRINVSPKGLSTLRILDARRVAYLDLTGSGAETAAHLLADGRLTLMFCSFDETPLILRLYGRGQIIRPEDADWPTLFPQFPAIPGARQIMLLHIESLQTSCGWGVPRYDFNGERDTLVEWADKKGETGLAQYRQEKNQRSIDGLPTGIPH